MELTFDNARKSCAKRPKDNWVTNRWPKREELEWSESDKCMCGNFLISYAGRVHIVTFTMYPRVQQIDRGKPTAKSWDKGYWDYSTTLTIFGGFKPDGWMSLPKAIEVKE